MIPTFLMNAHCIVNSAFTHATPTMNWRPMLVKNTQQAIDYAVNFAIPHHQTMQLKESTSKKIMKRVKITAQNFSLFYCRLCTFCTTEKCDLEIHVGSQHDVNSALLPAVHLEPPSIYTKNRDIPTPTTFPMRLLWNNFHHPTRSRRACYSPSHILSSSLMHMRMETLNHLVFLTCFSSPAWLNSALSY